MRTIPLLLLLVGCVPPQTGGKASVEPEKSIVSVRSRCVDTLRAVVGTTKSVPPQTVYRVAGYFYQIQAEIDLRVHEQFPESLLVVVLTPDDSLSLHTLHWKNAIDVTPATATFSFLVRSSENGLAHLKIVKAGEILFNRREIRLAGVYVSL